MKTYVCVRFHDTCRYVGLQNKPSSGAVRKKGRLEEFKGHPSVSRSSPALVVPSRSIFLVDRATPETEDSMSARSLGRSRMVFGEVTARGRGPDFPELRSPRN